MRFSACPIVPIQTTILQCFGQMCAFNPIRCCQIRDGPCDFQRPVIGPGREMQLFHSILQQLAGRWPDTTIPPELPMIHASVDSDRGCSFKSACLECARTGYAFANLRAAFGGSFANEFLKRDWHNLDMEINTVEQRTGNLSNVMPNPSWT